MQSQTRVCKLAIQLMWFNANMDALIVLANFTLQDHDEWLHKKSVLNLWTLKVFHEVSCFVSQLTEKIPRWKIAHVAGIFRVFSLKALKTLRRGDTGNKNTKSCMHAGKVSDILLGWFIKILLANKFSFYQMLTFLSVRPGELKSETWGCQEWDPGMSRVRPWDLKSGTWGSQEWDLMISRKLNLSLENQI